MFSLSRHVVLAPVYLLHLEMMSMIYHPSINHIWCDSLGEQENLVERGTISWPSEQIKHKMLLVL